ncbi:MAG: ATP synthase F1 subunit gamma [bacterium]|nr:ATP synthase F1 subunit gamma [bacterium]
MANRRVLVKRRKSVRNIRKITRTMQLIATSRFQKSHNRAVASRPYSDKLAELVGDLSRAAGSTDHPLMRTHDDADKGALVVITSNRGLCGGYNANVLRTAIEHIDSEAEAHGSLAPLRGDRGTEVTMVGKKGRNYFRFLGRETARELTELGDDPRFDQVEPLANELISRFENGEIRSAHVVYMRFISSSRQVPTLVQLLPLQAVGEDAEAAPSDGETTGGETSHVEYEFSPEPKALLDELLPASVRMRLFQCFSDAVVSEQVARMVAMKAATDAASDMITTLTRQYNRARQTHITMELLDIIGGAAAIE